jgi:hypothetical protein
MQLTRLLGSAANRRSGCFRSPAIHGGIREPVNEFNARLGTSDDNPDPARCPPGGMSVRRERLSSGWTGRSGYPADPTLNTGASRATFVTMGTSGA